MVITRRNIMSARHTTRSRLARGWDCNTHGILLVAVIYLGVLSWGKWSFLLVIQESTERTAHKTCYRSFVTHCYIRPIERCQYIVSYDGFWSIYRTMSVVTQVMFTSLIVYGTS